MGLATFVRHFETQSNLTGLFGDGPLDNVPTPKGEMQTAALLARLEPVAFDEVFTSPAARCIGTIGRFAEGATHFDDIVELKVGEWSGKSKTELPPDYLDAWRKGKLLPPGGESNDEFDTRLDHFYTGILLPSLQQGKKLLVATSGNPIRFVIAKVLGVPWRALLPQMDVDNCGLTTVRMSKGKVFVAGMNDTTHLAHIGVSALPGT